MPTPPRSFPGAVPTPRAPSVPDARPAPRPGSAPGLPAPRLWRSRSNRVVAGVLGGLAEKFGFEVLPVRLLYGVLTVLSAGTFVVPYVGLWLITSAHGPAPSRSGLWRSRSNAVVAGVLGGLAEKLGVRPAFVRVPYVALSVVTAGVPGLLLYLGLWAVTRPMDPPEA